MSIRAILAVPENNTTLFEEIVAYCGEFDEVALARVPRPHRTMTLDDYPDYRKSTLDAVAPLIGDGADLMIFGCTGAGFVAGPTGNREFMDQLFDLVGAPVVSTADSMVSAIKGSGAGRIDILSPYLGWKNQKLIAYFEAYEIEVGNIESFQASNISELAAIKPDQVLERALGLAAEDSDALFIACTQLPTRQIVGDLKSRLGRPIWSAARATAWDALRKLDLDAGRLA